jgi:hypothetical protein
MVGYVNELARTTIPQAAGPTINSAMTRLIDTAIDGMGAFPGAKQVAATHLLRSQNVTLAIDAVVRHHVGLATAQGVVTNIGGLVVAVIGIPANLTGIIVVQMRMVGAIGHLLGYDVDDRRVRTAMAMCLLGELELQRQISCGKLPTTPLAVATSPMYDPGLHSQVAGRVLARILTESAGKGIVVTIARKVPVIGGGVAGVADCLDTLAIARCARANLLPRRPSITTTSAQADGY